MFFSRVCRALPLFAVTLALVSPAKAEVVHFDFTARIDQQNDFLPIGSTFTGSFSYDTALTPTAVYPLAGGTEADYGNPELAISAYFLGNHYAGDATGAMGDDVGASTSDGPYDGLYILHVGSFVLGLTVADSSGMMWSSVGLPSEFPALSQDVRDDPQDDDGLRVPHASFDFFDLALGQGFTATVLTIEQAQATDVPEPATSGLMLLGTAVIAARRMSRRKKQSEMR
ncbi:PEP-CTERM sorting domain-containing protein [Parapedomonas caeni]